MGQQQFIFETDDGIATAFCRKGSALWLKQLLGLPCGLHGRNMGPPRSRGLGILVVDGQRLEAERLSLVESHFDQQTATFTWEGLNGGIRWESSWTLDRETGIWSRRDKLQNRGASPLTITRCLARFPFAPSQYLLYAQHSDWCNENQGGWQPLLRGGHLLYCRGGRTTQGNTPFLALRDAASNQGVSFHILPRGNWVIKVLTCPAGGTLPPMAIVELGLADEDLHLTLAPQESFPLPEILVQTLPGGQPELAAPRLHRYLQKHLFASARPSLPVVYNTWFDAFENLDPARLHRQLAVAKEIGCEVFVIDAGWYGAGPGNWSQQVGDWREKEKAAFRGQMRSFAEQVRAAGLGFGLWIEPERNHPSTPAVQEHPDWFLPGGKGFYYPDLTQDQVYSYIRAEMVRLIETYGLSWLKVDFNFELGNDPAELSLYYTRWYQLLDELRASYPQVILEGCASGGMRSDLHTLCHFDGHFLSDTVHPLEVLRIYQGALLRLPPGRLGKWLVLRSVGKTIYHYGYPPEESPETLVAPANATWSESLTVNIDFAARVAMAGQMGLSGDLASLSPAARQRLAEHIAFYKRWRELISRSLGHLLTPPKPKNEHTGWAAIQLQDPLEGTSLLFAYRLAASSQTQIFRLRGLDAQSLYTVHEADQPSCYQVLTGQELLTQGVSITLPQPNMATVWIITPQEA